jgi:hypothetical protein
LRAFGSRICDSRDPAKTAAKAIVTTKNALIALGAVAAAGTAVITFGDQIRERCESWGWCAEPNGENGPLPQPYEEQIAADISPLAAMPASEVIGANVVNAEGETVAEVNDLVTRLDDDRLFAVLRVGGFLGIGARDVVVDLEELDVGPDGDGQRHAGAARAAARVPRGGFRVRQMMQ